jgi:EAL domain-containing protein (putative c-di-GMP-specific phosphodiesterase class I)
MATEATGEILAGIVPVGDLSAVFQPIVNIITHKLVAYEMLTRCKTPGLTNPQVLFDRAAAGRFCGLLGRTVREIGFPQCRGVPLFVNVHPDELSDRYVIQPDDPIFGHDDEVFVEITESVPLSHYNLCSHMLKEMRSRGGIHLVVDDLGAGYSNLKRIADLEPGVVKLDRDLITDMDKNARQRILVRTVVNMCVELGAKVVAEGIETAGELQASIDAGVHYGQGYFLGRPANPPQPSTW